MNVLVVSATLFEAEMIIDHFGLKRFKNENVLSADNNSYAFDLLVTGVGMVNTAFHLGEYLSNNRPDIALNIGIAGAFTGKGLHYGDVVEVSEECYPEFGAGGPDGNIDMEKMGFPLFRINDREYYNRFSNPMQNLAAIKQVSGITVNHVHGTAEEIKVVQDLWDPEVESMESAAFFQCCLLKNIPFHVFRGISNFVEPRNKSNWQIEKAKDNVQKFVIEYIQNFIGTNE